MKYLFSNFNNDLFVEGKTKLILEFLKLHDRNELIYRVNEDTYNDLISKGYEPAKHLKQALDYL